MNTSIDNKITKLIIKGFVIATPGKLRKKIGQLDSDINTVNFEDVFMGSIHSKKIKIHNTTEDVISISYPKENVGVEFDIEPHRLSPAGYGELVLYFDTKNRDFGKISDDILLNTEIAGQIQSGIFYINANIVEDFSTLSAEELDNSPIISIQNETLILKNLQPGMLRSEKIEIENNGLRDLYVRNIQILSNNFNVEPTELTISPGRKASFNVSVTPDNYTLKLKTSISIISNDPNRSVINLTVIGKVDLPEGSSNKGIVNDIQIEKAVNLMKSYKGNDELIILDVRTIGEYNNGCIEDAVNVDFNSSNFRMMIKLMDKQKTYLVYCQSGIRSKEAVEQMYEIGFKNIYHMKEGIEGWKDKRLKLSDPNK